MDPRRTQRVSEALREELSELIGFEMSDPRVDSVDVTEVMISPDGKHAHVRVGVGGDEAARVAALAALDHARNYLRHEVAVRLSLRRVPELHFAADIWTEAEARLEVLFKRAKKASRSSTPPAASQPEKSSQKK